MKDTTVLHPIGDTPPKARLLYGIDVRDGLRLLEPESVHCVVTSPPYWALRDYGTAQWVGGDEACAHTVRSASATEGSRKSSTLGGGKKTVGHSKEGYKRVCGRCGAVREDVQVGLEDTPDDYVRGLIDVFREVRRVLRPDGTVWLNLGDTYAQPRGHGKWSPKGDKGDEHGQRVEGFWAKTGAEDRGLKGKDLVGIPWRVALALQADGWWLRNAIIWHKVNAMPSPVQDRFSCTYEHVFLLSKSAHYFFDLDAVRVPHTYGEYGADGGFRPAQQWLSEDGGDHKMDSVDEHLGTSAAPPRKSGRGSYHPGGKNPGDVYSLPTQPFAGSHFACFPEALPERCIRAGTSEHGVCSVCSSPWVRESSREDKQGNSTPGGGPKAEESQESREAGGVGRLDGGRRSVAGSTFHNNPRKRAIPDRKMGGWSPTCHCAAGLSRAVVLDPFSGSATTGRVSVRLGRDYVGVDLNESYLSMAIARVRDDPPPAPVEPPEEGSVLDVFGDDE